MTTLKGILGIHVTKHTYGDIRVNSPSRQVLGQENCLKGCLESLFRQNVSCNPKICPKEEEKGSGCTYNAKDSKYSEDHCGGVIVSDKVVDSSSNAEEDVQNTSDPDELLSECSGKSEVSPRQNQSDGEDKNE